jgi:SAM-dependent methyltransferase
MNLYDLIKRKDPCLILSSTLITCGIIDTKLGKYRSVYLPKLESILIQGFSIFSCNQVLSDDIGLGIFGADDSDVKLIFQVNCLDGQDINIPYRLLRDSSIGLSKIYFDWPQCLPLLSRFSLTIYNRNKNEIILTSGPLGDIRKFLTPLIHGTGIEVGPGLKPQILPSRTVDVRYVEHVHPLDWHKQYGKTPPQLPEESLLERYVESSATQLEFVENNSLDFIYSSHVFEHLPNPFKVLKKWHSKLKHGGWILAVIPDPRYTFDYRQPLTSKFDALKEESDDADSIPFEKYERWSKFTAPHQTAAEFMKRKYPIHVNFFTPESLSISLDDLIAKEFFEKIFIYTVPNGKDYALVLKIKK